MYNFLKGAIWLIARILFRVRVTGKENIPKEGAFLLCGNHIHAFDGAVLIGFCKRRLRIFAKKEIFKNPFFAWVFRNMGAFPVNREGTDMQAYRHTVSSLKEGWPVLIFSQGTRMAQYENAKSGVAVFALKTTTPIIPVGISGTYKIGSKMKISYGVPISMEEYAGQKIKTELVDEVMAKLADSMTELLK